MDFLNGTVVSKFVADLGVWPLIVVVVPVLIVRRHGSKSVRKRKAILIQGIAVFLMSTAAQANMAVAGGKDLYFYLAILTVGLGLYFFRKHALPYRFTCVECGVRLDSKTIYMLDDDLCESCRASRVTEREEVESSENPEESVESPEDKS